MTVNIENESELNFDFDFEKVIRDVVEAALDHEKCPYEAVVEVVLTDNEGIHEMNLSTRGIDRETDVLSYPMLDFETPADFSEIDEESFDYFDPDSGELLLGDIMISCDRVKAQAEEYGHSEKRELAFLVAHSMLHLMGYDHMEDSEREIMEEKQEEILETLKIRRT